MKIGYVLLCALVVAGCGGDAPPKNLNVGDIAPTFQTLRRDGSAVHFPAAWTGQPVVVRFWADWCRFCAPEMKLLDGIAKRYQAQRLAVIAINVGQDRKRIHAFMENLGVGYPALLDEQGKIAKSWGVVGLPTTFFVDARGVVRGKIVGEANEALFERHVQALLE
jgi:cytochrome c biogenesis protein CcmG/thiol:disulfide interchange protein DsbE